MPSRIRSPHVYTPGTLIDALSLKLVHPNALIFAGGSYILSGNPGTLDLPGEVISLKNIDELMKITRTERFFEIGSMVSLTSLLATGRNVFPQVLTTALSRIGNPAVRNLATLGGNLAVAERRLTLFPVLHVLDARLELRHTEGARWVPISRFIDPIGKPVFEKGEILTRVRIPLTQWSIQSFSGPDQSIVSDESPATFCGIAGLERELISDFRFIFSFSGTFFLRSRALEAELVGRKLPLSAKLKGLFMEDFRELMSLHENALSRYQREQTAYALETFLHSLPSE